tara:strand:- start:1654 stop:1884 length:231 start_codon:yes stop_codon:yes gene_type:complete
MKTTSGSSSSDSSSDNDNVIITNRFSTRATRRYAAYKADMEAIELEIAKARDKLVNLTNTKHILQLAGLSNYDYIK